MAPSIRLLVSVAISAVVVIGIGQQNLYAQAPPDAVSFQAVARDADGIPLSMKAIAVRLMIRRGDTTGAVVYDERHDVSTDDLGHFSVEIGRGVAAGGLSAVDWSNGPFFLTVAMDIDNTGTWIDLGSQEMLSVPYALYARSARRADTASIAMDLGIVLSPRRGGTGSSDEPVDGGVVYGDDGVFRFTPPGRVREILTSTGSNAPTWQALQAMIDTAVINVIDSMLINDRSFMDSVYREISERVSTDTMVIRAIARDSVMRETIRETVYDVLADSSLWKRWYRVIRDSLLRDSAFVQPLYVTIRNELANDSTFINALFRNRLFVQRLDELIDAAISTKAWLLTGNAGTTESSYIGTRDARPFAIRTNARERLRVDSAGNVGIGTSSPQRLLDVRGSIGLAGALVVADDPGQAGRVLVSNGAQGAPRWTDRLALTKLTVSDTAVFNGPAVFNDTVIMRRNWSMALPAGHIYVGNDQGIATAVAPGLEGHQLRILNGRPQWGASAAPPETWLVGGNTAPTSTLLGNMNGDLQLVAGGQPRLRLAGADGRVHVSSLSGVPGAGGLALTDGVVVAAAGGDLRKVDASALISSLGGSVPVSTGQTTVEVSHPSARPGSVIVATYEDLNDSEFIFCQVVARGNGSFRIRLSGAPRPDANARVNFLILNP